MTRGGGNGSRFAWYDEVFLRALEEEKWVLLDELNLAMKICWCMLLGDWLPGVGMCVEARLAVILFFSGSSAGRHNSLSSVEKQLVFEYYSHGFDYNFLPHARGPSLCTCRDPLVISYFDESRVSCKA